VQRIKVAFIEPMLLLPAPTPPEGANWAYELKLDGYRAVAIKTDGKVLLRSRNNKDFNSRYPAVAKALAALPDETVIDGEVVALDASGRPSFSIVQNHGSSGAPIVYYVFDVLFTRAELFKSIDNSSYHHLWRQFSVRFEPFNQTLFAELFPRFVERLGHTVGIQYKHVSFEELALRNGAMPFFEDSHYRRCSFQSFDRTVAPNEQRREMSAICVLPTGIRCPTPAATSPGASRATPGCPCDRPSHRSVPVRRWR